MNIYLIPYTGLRHVSMALVLGATGLLAWWWALFQLMVVSPFLYSNFGILWSRAMEGPLYLGSIVVFTAAASVFFEGALRRRALRWRVFWSATGAALALIGTLIGMSMMSVVMPLFTSDATDALLADGSLVTLRFRIGLWTTAGMWSGFGPFVVRRLHAFITRRWTWGGRDGTAPPPSPTWLGWFAMLFAHTGGGSAAGAMAAVAWYVPGYYDDIAGDLYLSGALAATVFGTLHGLLVWPLPDELYAGWLRVLSFERYGLRIPIPHADGTSAERFVGHFPRGLDLYLPADRGVAELHASFVLDGDRRYTVRGLSVQPSIVKRTLERIDLRYDPRRPAPLETTLRMEDKVSLGPASETVLEFVMLPKEER